MSDTIIVYNSSKQSIPLSVRPPDGEFYSSEQQITLMPGKQVSLLRSHVNIDQINNLQKKGILKVLKQLPA